MKSDDYDLSDRLLEYAAKIVKLTGNLKGSYTCRHISGQLMRSATSAGANYEEACSAESRPDFIHKMQIVLKELRESVYWLQLTEKAEIAQAQTLQISEQLGEGRELMNIIAKSIVTARK